MARKKRVTPAAFIAAVRDDLFSIIPSQRIYVEIEINIHPSGYLSAHSPHKIRLNLVLARTQEACLQEQKK